MSLRPGKGSKQYPDNGVGGSTTASSSSVGGGYYMSPTRQPPPALNGTTSTTQTPIHDLSSSSRHSTTTTAVAAASSSTPLQSPYHASTSATTPRAHSIGSSGSPYAAKLPPSPYLGGGPTSPTSPYKNGGGTSVNNNTTSYFSPTPPPLHKRSTASSTAVNTTTATTATTSPYASPRAKIQSSHSPYRVAYSQPPPPQQAIAVPPYSDNSHLSDDGYYKEKKIVPQSNSLVLRIGSILLKHWSLCLAVFLLIQLVRVRWHEYAIVSATGASRLSQVANRVRDLQRDAESLREQLREQQTRAQEDRRLALQKLQQVQSELQSLGPDVATKLERAEKREEAWMQQVQLLQQATTREARRAATEKFGPGPHYVQIFITLPHLDGNDRYQSFVVEMASLQSMPHAVHLFLEQVAHNLWNRAWFYVNGPHVLQGGPQASGAELEDGEEERTVALRPFRERQLDSLAFPEYSEDFPHVPYTLGFTGRPGGPDFYINKVNNTEAHGPGGQFQHELDEYADPCFAKVVPQYQSVVDTMIRSPTILDPASDYAFFLEEPIYITKMVIVDDPLQPKPKQFPSSPRKTQVEDSKKEENTKSSDNEKFTDEEVDTLMGQFLEAMHSSDGLEFVEKQLQSERGPYDNTAIFDLLSQAMAGEHNEKAKQLLEALVEGQERNRKPLKPQKVAETNTAVASNKGSGGTDKKATPVEAKGNKPDALPAADEAASGMDTTQADSRRSSRRKEMKRRYKPIIDHVVQP